MPTRILVNGAGPVGCVTALRLARFPHVEVTLVEKRSLHELFQVGSSKRSYCMVIKGRGLAAFEHLGLQLPSAQTKLNTITVLPQGIETRAELGRLVQRNLVALELLRAAAQMMGLRVLLGTAAATVDFEAQRLGVISSHTDVEAQDDSERILEAWDDRLPANRTCINVEAAAELLSTTTESVSTWLPTHGAAVSNDATLAYDMLVATDGAFSRVREAAVQAGLLAIRDQLFSDQQYKTFSSIQTPPDAKDLPRWLRSELKPFESFAFGASVTDNAWRVALWRTSADRFAGKLSRVSDEDKATPEAIDAAFPGAFPEWMRAAMAAKLNCQAACGYGGVIICSQLHVRNSVALVGDAGHAMTINLGEGCNTGLESSIAFCEVAEASLVRGELPLHAVPARYSKLRMPQAHAMQRIERMFAIANGHAPAPSWLAWVHATLGVLCGDAVAKVALVRRPDLGASMQRVTALAPRERKQADVLRVIDGLRWAVYGAALVPVVMLVQHAL